ncbi:MULTISPECIES: acyloxyacyl hydrolase [unclassified Pseudophaeobacter]|uniref:acyloxyacyl hydrolase n=1 Tax=unclassified Pseudophaeobacter TaxID=2637024 RepID=UPI0020B16C32|nr:acyloxyacyl hydrolase [Pseudophaeobacter sp. EL27]
MKNNILLSTVLAVGFASSALGQEIVLGAGYSDYSLQGSEDGVTLSMEYIHRPFYEGRVFSARLAGALEVVETGDAFVGGGVSGKWDLQQDWFISASVLPGAYVEGTSLNDLGSTFEIRSQLAVGKRFKSGKALSLALSHKSNASTASINPGVNTLSLRWHIPLN